MLFRFPACIASPMLVLDTAGENADHRAIAIRLHAPGENDSYYPTQYGCLDPACVHLVDVVAGELLGRNAWVPPAEINDRLAVKLRTTESALRGLAGDRDAD